MQTLRYALVGGGAGIAATHLAALQKLQATDHDVHLVALADPSEQPARQRAESLGCAYYIDHQTMLMLKLVRVPKASTRRPVRL